MRASTAIESRHTCKRPLKITTTVDMFSDLEFIGLKKECLLVSYSQGCLIEIFEQLVVDRC